MSGIERFDRAAATWDLTERRVLLAQGVAEAIAAQVPLSREVNALDFGCGTGLIALTLGPRVGSMTGADASPAMLKTLEEKADRLGIPVRLKWLDVEERSDLGGPYDLILSSMTLHHIADVPALLRLFLSQLKPGGQVALADLEEEDGSFHEDPAGVYHQGFSRDQIQDWLEQSGFRQIRLGTAAVTTKGGRDYPVFLAVAKSPMVGP